VGAPVSGQTYGNGFATGSKSITAGFTDFVLFSINRPYAGGAPAANFALYHLRDGTDGNVASNIVGNGVPIAYQPPSGQNPNQIAFQIDLAQLYPNSSQPDAVNKARLLTWVQLNAVSTDQVPTESQTTIIKRYDSFGDDTNGVGSFLLANLVNETSWTSSDSNASGSAVEPSFNDEIVSPPGSALATDPALDLISWSIIIQDTGSREVQNHGKI
jgi:hypothetical protein